MKTNANTDYDAKSLIAVRLCFTYATYMSALALFAISVCADQSNQVPASVEIPAIKTKIIDGFCIGLTGWNGDFYTNNTSVDDELIFLPWTTNANSYGYDARITVPATPEYAYQVELFDTNGVALSKTKFGETVGTKFFDFDTNAYRNGIAIEHLPAKQLGEITSSPLLFRPSDLFNIAKPGKYTLWIRFQIETFPRFGPGRKDYTDDIIRFPALNYPLVKSDVAPTNSLPK